MKQPLGDEERVLGELLYLYAARAARGFGDGFASIILTAYLIELEHRQ
jgi:hypothetical protein